MLLVRLLHYGQLVVTFLDSIDRGIELLTKRLVLVVLNTHRARLDVIMVRPLRVFGIVDRDELLSGLVIHYVLALVHGLVECIDSLIVTESRVDLLLDDTAHDVT